MANVTKEKLIPHLESYRNYLEDMNREEQWKTLNNTVEDYKRVIAQKAKELPIIDKWTMADIGTGKIGELVIQALDPKVPKTPMNLINYNQKTSFKNKIRERTNEAETILYALYHEHKDEDSFSSICELFGRKYDLISYLYFIFDPEKYLPISPGFFDEAFRF